MPTLASPDATLWSLLIEEATGALVATDDGVAPADVLVVLDSDAVPWQLKVEDDGTLVTTTDVDGGAPDPVEHVLLDSDTPELSYLLDVEPDGTLFTFRDVPVLVSAGKVQQTPSVLTISIANGDMDADVYIHLPDAPSDDTMLNLGLSGSIGYANIFVRTPLNAGIYPLRVTHPGRLDAVATFTVLEDPDLRPTALAPDALPTPVPEAGYRWVLQAKEPGGEQYVFPINPTSVSPMYAPNVLQAETTTAPDGQVLTWEGARKVLPFSFKGYLDSEMQYNALQRWTERNARFYLIDHRARAWVVTFESFSAEPKRNMLKPWAHSYQVNATIHSGPMRLE